MWGSNIKSVLFGNTSNLTKIRFYKKFWPHLAAFGTSVPWSEVKVTQFQTTLQLYLTLCDPMDYTVHGILQARILEWVAFPFSRGSSQHRDRTQVSHIAGRFFTSWTTRLVPWPGVEPEPPALEGEVLSTGSPGKSPQIRYLNVKKDKEICHTLVIPGNMTSGYKW